MQRFLKRYFLWLLYAAFLLAVSLFVSRESMIAVPTDFVLAKYLLLLVFLAFLGFSFHANRRENFFRSIGAINRLLWGRQVGLDLYISVFLSLALIYLVENDLAVLLLWALPVLVFANLAILPYILLNFSEIVSYFVM